MDQENQTSSSVLRLLAMTIFADKRVLSEEIKVFVETVLAFQKTGVIQGNFTEARLILWYETNKDEFSNILERHSFTEWFSTELSHLSDFEHKSELIEAVLKIARSDDDEHVSEQALAVLMAKKWNLEQWGLSQLDAGSRQAA